MSSKPEGTRGVQIQLASTAEIEIAPPPARVWRGLSDQGVPIVAFITIAAGQSGDPRVDARMQEALETRVTSLAQIYIPASSARRRR
jgi:hypothetical protein